MLYLSRLTLNVESAAARRCMVEPYQLHRTLLRAFDASRSAAGMLYRLDLDGGEPRLLVQSLRMPDWSALAACPPTHREDAPLLREPPRWRPWQPSVIAGAVLRFRLRANPTFKRGRRRLAWLQPEQQVEWLRRQARAGGFVVQRVAAVREGFVPVCKPGRPTTALRLYSVLFDGLIEVSSLEAMTVTLSRGLGSGRAFGFGLLSVASVETSALPWG